MSTEQDEDIKRVEGVAKALMEHYDSVQIFVTRQDGYEQTTMELKAGYGNFYARLGQIQTWLTRQDEEARNYQRSLHDDDEEDN